MFKSSKHIASDSEIIEAAENFKKGSAEAFHILYNKYQQNIYRFCLRMLGDSMIAKDAFQEIFIKVYEHRTNFKGNNFAAWLYTIARNTCLNYIRARKDHEIFDEIYHGQLRMPNSDIGMREFIEKSIAQLPLTLREALILREYEERSYQEIADILGIELSLAKVRVHRARLLLRKMLQPLMKEIHET